MNREHAIKNTNARTVFYSITVVSIVMFIIGLTMSGSVSGRLSTLIGLKGQYFDFADYLIILPVSIWAWLSIAGFLLIRKNWDVKLVSFILLIPHILLIALSIAHSYGIVGILKMYLAILSFGIIRL